MSYEVGGEQYLAVVAGWGGVMPLAGGDAARKGSINVNRSRVLAFKLNGQAKLPEPEPAPPLAPPPARVKNAAQVAAGKAEFLRTCGVCHGDASVGAGVIPDLRYSPTIQSAEAWKSVAIDGALKDHGMVSFTPVLGPADAEAIRAYVIGRANDLYEETHPKK
jgi:quinohemoprotein ethanol dehydrogenase